jgi:hypothetical protein
MAWIMMGMGGITMISIRLFDTDWSFFVGHSQVKNAKTTCQCRRPVSVDKMRNFAH